MCVLGTENFFSDHTGVVLYDPIYHESKFKLLEQNAVNCTSIDYNETHGTLAFGDVMGQIVLCSIQNPRRIFGMGQNLFIQSFHFNTLKNFKLLTHQTKQCLERATNRPYLPRLKSKLKRTSIRFTFHQGKNWIVF